MIIHQNLLRRLTAFIALTTATSLWAESIQIGGPHRPGHARPPLHLNLTPSVSTYYSPAQIRHAYGFDQIAGNGAGQKVAIVDAYGNANIQSDLNTFCSQFGLSSTTVQVLGNNPGTDTGWALETALDVEWAHAIAPGATIILSVAPSSGIIDLLNAVDAAVNAGATVVSMSWGGGEFAGMSTYDSHFNRANVAFTASSGDNGAGVEWPAVSPYVIGVGGTTLTLDSNNNRVSETAWSGSGGGASLYSGRPSFQNGWQTATGRGVPDVSYLADPNTGVLVYDSVNGGWLVVGGTSAGAPQWAAAIALANQIRLNAGAATLGWANVSLYPLAQGSTTTPYSVNPTYFYDVSSGSNGAYSAGPPYDFVTGVGSLLANSLLPALAPTAPNPDFSIAASPGSISTTAGAGSVTSVSITSMGGFGGSVGLSASGLPAGATASFAPASVTGSGASTLTLSTSASTPAGNYTITISGTSGSLVHSTVISLAVQAPVSADFSLSLSPGSASIKAGRTASFTAAVGSIGGFNSAVNLTVSGVPSGATASLSASSVTGSGNATLNITTTSSTARGTFTITVTGVSSGHTHSASASLRIR